MWVTVTATATARYFNLVLKLEPVLIIYSLYVNVMDGITWNANILPKNISQGTSENNIHLVFCNEQFCKKNDQSRLKTFLPQWFLLNHYVKILRQVCVCERECGRLDNTELLDVCACSSHVNQCVGVNTAGFYPGNCDVSPSKIGNRDLYLLIRKSKQYIMYIYICM